MTHAKQYDVVLRQGRLHEEKAVSRKMQAIVRVCRILPSSGLWRLAPSRLLA